MSNLVKGIITGTVGVVLMVGGVVATKIVKKHKNTTQNTEESSETAETPVEE